MGRGSGHHVSFAGTKKLIILTNMIRTDNNALICDLAETYHIYDYRSLPCSVVAALSVGLRDNSRIKLKLSGMRVSLETMLLASIADAARLIWWGLTEDGRKNRNRPVSILQTIINKPEDRSPDIVTFSDGDSFAAEWDRITHGKEG